MIWALAFGGCRTGDPSRSEQAAIIAIRYDLAPLWMEQGPVGSMDRIRGDLESLARLGVNTVVVAHDVAMLTPEVQRWGAGLGLNVVSWNDILTAGVIGQDRCGSLSGTDRAAVPRMESLAVIPIGDRSGEVDASPTENWISSYARQLCAGRTRGMLMDRFRRLPGDPEGLVDDLGVISPSKRAALRCLLERVRVWGGCLEGAAATPLRPLPGSPETLRTLLFRKGDRSFVLVTNPSADQFVRGAVRLTDAVAGGRADRAVEVSGGTSALTGHVVRASHGALELPVVLRPGDAILFELF